MKSVMQKAQKKQITVSVPCELFLKLSSMAAETHRSRSQLVNLFLERGYSNLEKDLELEARIFGKVKI